MMKIYFKRCSLEQMHGEKGTSAIEYVLIAAMVAIVLAAFFNPVRTAVETIYTQIVTSLLG